MANEEDSAQEEQEEQQNEQDLDADKISSSSDSDYDSDKDSDDDSSHYSDETLTYTRPSDNPPESENTPEINIRQLTEYSVDADGLG